jgi:hypothetical protein
MGRRNNEGLVGWGRGWGGNAPAKDVEALQALLFGRGGGGGGTAGVRGGQEGRRRWRWRLLDVVGVLDPVVGHDHGVVAAFPPAGPGLHLVFLHLQTLLS